MTASPRLDAPSAGAGALPAVGALLADRYRVTRLLGQGGIGAVFAASDTRTGQDVAIKMLLPALAFDGEVRARFVREATATASIRHPNVVRVLDIGTADRGVPYLAMELLEGRDLGVIAEVEGPVPPARAVGLLLQGCAGLAAAHGRGIVHRDVKGANLFLSREAAGVERVKVVDFGLAKAVDTAGDARAKSLTNTAASFGTPTHMAPEQVRSSKHVDARADVWAMGVVAYELLTGRLPFDGPSVGAVLAAVIADVPAPLPPSVPRGLAAVVLRCLEKDPERRFASMAALGAALAPFASRADAAATAAWIAPAAAVDPEADTVLRVERPRARRVPVAVLAALGVVVGAGAVVAAARLRAPAVVAPSDPAVGVSAPASPASGALAAAPSASPAHPAAPASAAPPASAAAAATSTTSPSPRAPAARAPARRVPDPTADRE